MYRERSDFWICSGWWIQYEVYGCFESPKQRFAAKLPPYPCPAAWEVMLIPFFYYLHLIICIFFSQVAYASIKITAAFSIWKIFRYTIIQGWVWLNLASKFPEQIYVFFLIFTAFQFRICCPGFVFYFFFLNKCSYTTCV